MIPVVGGESGTVQLSDVVYVETSNFATVALKANGTVFTWGVNRDGLGNGVSTSSVSPVQILKGSAPSPISNKFLENIVEINIDDSWFGNQGLSGGLTQDGELYVWGTDRKIGRAHV